MPRIAITALLLGAGLFGSVEAEAANKDRTWGMGPRVGAFLIPARYPALPSNLAEADHGLLGTRYDLQVGLDGWYGVDARNRVGGGLSLGASLDGTRYLGYDATLHYDRVLRVTRPLCVVAGIQAGFGALRLVGENGDERYHVRHHPVRIRLQAQYVQARRLLGLGLFAQTSVPTSSVYLDAAGVQRPTVQGPLGVAPLTTVGIDVQLLFGHFGREPGRG